MSDINTSSAPRGRRRKSAIQIAAEVVADAPEAPEPTSNRPAMRLSLRDAMHEEDPRTRAARRAAEVRNNIGSLDEGSDDFYIDQNSVPDGWSYEWKTKSVMGQENPAYQVSLARTGWEPVPAERHPSYMPDGGNYKTIERKGMILMERPKELTDEAKSIEYKKARNQIRQKEQQLNSAPEGQFGRNNKDAPLVKISKSYDAIPIPD